METMGWETTLASTLYARVDVFVYLGIRLSAHIYAVCIHRHISVGICIICIYLRIFRRIRGVRR